MTLRIVAGSLGGRRIHAPPGRSVRPTPERVREAWFSAIGERIEGAAVLDLFAGSGALGIEALSRGAARVHFVEADRRAFAVLRANLRELQLAGRALAVRADVFQFLRRVDPGQRFNVALADPPYKEGLATRLVHAFRAAPFADLLCVEHAADEELAGGAAWTRTYGDTALSFFVAGSADADQTSHSNETGGATGG